MNVPDDLAIGLITQHAAHERPFNLEVIRPELVEEVIGGITAAEIVERQFAAEGAQGLDVLMQAIAQRNGFAFGDFDRNRTSFLAGRLGAAGPLAPANPFLE